MILHGLILAVLACGAVDPVFSVRTEPVVPGVEASVSAQRSGDEWKLAVSAVNKTPTNVVLKVVLTAVPRLRFEGVSPEAQTVQPGEGKFKVKPI